MFVLTGGLKVQGKAGKEKMKGMSVVSGVDSSGNEKRKIKLPL